jgi:hypothetical protein
LALSEAELERRRKDLRERLQPLTADYSYIQASYEPLGTNDKAIKLHQGQKGGLRYNQCRINLTGSDLSVCYFEIWQYIAVSTGQRRGRLGSVGRPPLYQLEKAYLHVYSPKSSGDEEEVLFLHCDPQLPRDSKHHKYKAGPHVHFEVAGDPWSRAHVPLCHGWQKEVLKNMEALDAAIGRAVEFIADELVPLAGRR